MQQDEVKLQQHVGLIVCKEIKEQFFDAQFLCCNKFPQEK
jgi:hypothetical protein